MKYFKHLFVLMLCVLPCVAGATVATTAGSNLTAWNGNSGSTNNNNWNTMMNSRVQPGGNTKAKADFGNCNSLILRCAQPKCAACTTIDLAKSVVSGCVNTSKECKKHGEELIEYIAAQIVASAAEKLQAQELAIKQAEAQAAAAASQNNAQIADMQKQMAQLQADLAQRDEEQMQKIQDALDAQKEANTQISKPATAGQVAVAPTVEVTPEQQLAVEAGVDPDLLVRKQVGGEIMTAVEAAEKQLIALEETMDEVFRYAGCDNRGNNCSGPKRVKIFKDKALKFFDPYEAIADEMYDALDTALAVGVDVSDVLMMLSGACNKWGKYMCTGEKVTLTNNDGTKVEAIKHEPVFYKSKNCIEGRSVAEAALDNNETNYVRGGFECRIGQAVPPQDDIRCTRIGLIDNDSSSEDGVQREWLNEAYDGDKFIRVGCASSVLDTIAVFGGRKNKLNKAMGLDVLERIILQDAPEYAGSSRYGNVGGDAEYSRTKYCAMTTNGYNNLHNAVVNKKLPNKICVKYDDLERSIRNGGLYIGSNSSGNTVYWLSSIDEKQCNNLNEDLGNDVKKGCELEWCASNSSNDYCKNNKNRCVAVNAGKLCKIVMNKDNQVEGLDIISQ